MQLKSLLINEISGKENAIMKANFRVLVAISSLALAALACQAVMGGSETDVPATDVVTESTPEPLDT